MKTYMNPNKITITISTSAIFMFLYVSPAFAWFGIGEFVGNTAKKLGASEKVAKYISAGVDAYTQDPRGNGRLVVEAVSDAGIVGDANSCAAFADLASTGAAAVAAAYSGGTAAGIAKSVGGQVMGNACSDKYGSPDSGMEEARQAYKNNAPSVPQEILIAQIKAGERIVELQTQGKIEEAKILAKSALDVENTKQKGETDRAVIQSQTLLKMTEMNNSKDLEEARIGLEGLKDTNRTNLEITKLNGNTSKTNTIVTTFGDVLKGTISSSAQSSQTRTIAKAEVEKEKIKADKEIEIEKLRLERDKIASVSATDPITQMLTQWGWTRVQCLPGAAFITGLAIETVCVNPSPSLPAGQYSFDRNSNQLTPIGTTQILQPAQTTQSPIENNF